MVRSQENKEFGNAFVGMMVHTVCKHYLTVFALNEGFMFFDRKTRRTLWKHLKANIP